MSSVFNRKTTHRLPVFDEHDDDQHDASAFEQDHPNDEPVIPTLREAFLAGVRIAMQRVERIEDKRWVRAYVKSHAAGGCMYCGRALSLDGAAGGRAVMDTLIPLSAGGSTTLPNLVLACTTCYAEKGDRDWITFGRAVRPAFLARNRRKALRYAGNHVLPLSVKGTRAAERVFDARWENPRFRAFAGCFATSGFFAWNPLTLPRERRGEVVLSLRMGFGGKVSNDGGDLVVVEVPHDAFHAAAWMLIEQNVLLHAVELPGLAAGVYLPFRPTLDAEHQERWSVVLPGSRWEQEARRVARWSGQAQVLQRELKSDEQRSAMLRPVHDGFVQARASIAALFEEVTP